MKCLYRLYQLFIFIPIFLLLTLVIGIIVIVGCMLGFGHFCSYYPGRFWSWITVRLLLLPVKVEGRENLEDRQSYVFVANHQGVFDIFLIYGFLHKHFKWMMKKELRRIFIVGKACESCRFIFVDKSSPSAIKRTYHEAREVLKEGVSLTVFPEGARTFTGHMGYFKRGAFMLADEIQLPVCPLTINGSFNVMPRMRDGHWVNWYPLRLTIHKPIYPIGKGKENQDYLKEESYKSVMSALVQEYQGYVENLDQ